MIIAAFIFLFYNIDILNTFSELYSQKKYEDFVNSAEKFLIEENNIPISGSLINQYISVCEKTNKNPTIFLKKLSTLKKDYTITEYAIFSTGYYYYKKDIYDQKITVKLDFLGDCMGGYDDSKEVPLYGLTFCKYGTYEAIELKNISKRLYSEIYGEVKTIAESGSGFNANWAKESW